MNDKSLNLRFKIWLETDQHESVLGDGKWLLLKTIEETGSLKRAMKQLGLSYRKTWDNLNKIESTLGFELIERQRGGISGGKSTLSPRGKKIVEIFDRFHNDYDVQLEAYLNKLAEELKNID